MKKAKLLEELGVQGTKKSEPTLEKTRKALEKMGNPQDDYEVILVGGTNGKGSTVEMISEMLQARGHRVGVNKSPHLVSPTERIKVDSEEIEEPRMKELAEKILDLKPDLSFFELMTVMAYLYFSEKSVDYAVVEVGMGGRLDATNAVSNSMAVITNVGMDHKEYLGETREEIAEEKAGIIPEDGEVVKRPEIDVLNQEAGRKEASLHSPVEVNRKEELLFDGRKFSIPVQGEYQVRNLETALKTVEVIDQIPEDLDSALSDLKCPGRMEKVSEDPEVILDGAHNLEAVEEIMKEIEPGFTCVFNCTEKKERKKMIETVEEKAKKMIFTESDIEWSEDAETLQRRCSIESEVEKDVEKALRRARKTADGRILVTGSLYLVGDVKSSFN